LPKTARIADLRSGAKRLLSHRKEIPRGPQDRLHRECMPDGGLSLFPLSACLQPNFTAFRPAPGWMSCQKSKREEFDQGDLARPRPCQGNHRGRFACCRALPDFGEGLKYKPVTVKTPDGLTVSAQEWGSPSGPEILFIHGFSQRHLSWMRQVDGDLAGDFRISICDLRGRGNSDKPPEPAACRAKWFQCRATSCP